MPTCVLPTCSGILLVLACLLLTYLLFLRMAENEVKESGILHTPAPNPDPNPDPKA